MSQTASVTWQTPTTTDNSGTVTVSQTKGAAPGSSFQLGLTEIRYEATDANGNQSPECIFFVNVEEIVCDPPLIADKYLFYQCPDGYTYGSTCQLKCMGSFPLIGNETITCERNDSFTPPRGYWDMGELQPYCSKNPCDTLLAPENGAMSCATWMFGMQCQMQCSGQYDIPYGTVGSNGAPFTGQFTCSESLGEYTPSNTVPGCTQLRRPDMTTVLGEFFYYTGDCNDPTVLVEIKNNFIKQMQRLESQGWNGVCPSQIDCNVNNTEVTCGPYTPGIPCVDAVIASSQLKTNLESSLPCSVNGSCSINVSTPGCSVTGRRRRSASSQTITLTQTLTSGDNLDLEAFEKSQNVSQPLYDLLVGISSLEASAIQINSTHSILQFEISGTQYSSTAVTTNSLVECSAGQGRNKAFCKSGVCVACSVGTYQDESGQSSCKSCPSGLTTKHEGSQNMTDCSGRTVLLRFGRLNREQSTLKGSWASLNMVNPNVVRAVPPTSNVYKDLRKSKSILSINLGKTTAIVTWNAPTASDPEDGPLTANLAQGGAPGTHFDRGSHTIVYTASDNTGASTYCSFSFKIIVVNLIILLLVLTCDPIQWPLHGYVRCDKSEFMYGSKCTVGCFEGYEMEPQPSSVPYQIMCDKSSDNKAILDRAVPTCKAITCPINATELDVDNGSPVCTHSNHKYDSSCVTQCESGYSLSSGIVFSTCQEDKTWSTNLPDCKDTEVPEILNCPQTIYAYTDKMSQTASVTWQTPTATDNSGPVTVSQTKGAAPGSSFQLGLTEIRYKAIDANGNQSPECIFFVSVEEIVCDPPLIADKYLFYQCPDGYTYGSTCQLKCMGSFPLIGNETITCERNDSFTPPRGYWDIGEFQPYCLKNPCDTLPAPENGAMSCATWLFGMQCQMQCSKQYDIPFGTVGSNGVPFTGLFTCSESSGEYTPSNTVPGCTQLRRPDMTTVLGEFFYYTGDCNDPTVLVEIKSNFINQMQLLESQGWNGVCPSQIDCNVNNTEVTCGPVSGKKKRDINYVMEHVMSKRSTHEIRVEVKLATTWYDFNSTGGSTFYFLEEVQKKVFEVMKSSATAGNLTVSGLSPDISSFALGYSDPDCPQGTFVRWSSLGCVPCSEGSFLDTSDPMKPHCRDCLVGTYKDSPDDLACTSCPPGTSTENTGTINSTDCLSANSPRSISVVSSVQYTPGIPCIDAALASSKLTTNLESSLPCSVNGSCSITVSTPGCSASGRRRRSASSQTITLTQTLTSGDNLDLEAYENSQSVSQPLYDLLVGISSLEASAIQINSTHSILQFEISGTQYTSTAVTTNSLVECSPGQGRSEALCIDCPRGTYSESGVCVACSIGTYQDESGQSSCKSCPGGLTTKYEGSQNITDCSGKAVL
uniref:Sushi, von Willebrand factor type A, EGF and pentraxin domain-containing protein 1 n=1 Tax=Magallana gigas TaxID=29159 RepID=K1QIC0_MAGGI